MAKILSLQAGQLDRLARRINAAHSKAGDAASKAVTHAIECGLALIEARAILDHGEWAKWIEANCSFSYRMAAHYIRIASTLPYLPAEKLKRVIQLSLRECIKAIAGNNTIAVMGSSESDEWHSPSSIFSLAVRLMGRVDLDPCAHRNSPVVARKRYSIGDNGLSKSWRGTVFMNPPHRGIADWIEKLVVEYQNRNVSEAIALLPARVDTSWWRLLDQYPRVFIHDRLKFHNSDVTAPLPSSAIFMGRNVRKFAQVFGAVGTVFVKYPG